MRSPRTLIVGSVCLAVMLLASTWVVAQQQPTIGGAQASAAPPTRSNRLLYVAVPGTAESQNGVGVLAFDVENNFKFVKRIPTWDYPAWQDPARDEVKGFIVAGHRVTDDPRAEIDFRDSWASGWSS